MNSLVWVVFDVLESLLKFLGVRICEDSIISDKLRDDEMVGFLLEESESDWVEFQSWKCESDER